MKGVSRSRAKLPDRAPRVVIIYKSMPQYREPFFEILRTRLTAASIDLEVIYGQPSRSDAKKRDTVKLPWGVFVPNRFLTFGSREVIWQPVLSRVNGADLVIVEQASKLLVNFVLIGYQSLGKLRLAFWGHGKNFQAGSESRLGEMIKRRISRSVHWWFAYNETSARVVLNLGFPSERITTVQNAIDTSSLSKAKANVSQEQIESIKSQLGVKGTNIGIFCGGLYPEKRLEFLFDAAEALRQKIPDFELIVIGDGAERPLAESAARAHPWIHSLGGIFGGERAPYFMMSKVMLLPGLVGLALIDAFLFEVPLVTVDVPFHSPEIEYLESGANGLMLPSGTSPAEYAAAVCGLLGDEERLETMRSGCRDAASKYTMENMVERFAQGVERALGS